MVFTEETEAMDRLSGLLVCESGRVRTASLVAAWPLGFFTEDEDAAEPAGAFVVLSEDEPDTVRPTRSAAVAFLDVVAELGEG